MEQSAFSDFKNTVYQTLLDRLNEDAEILRNEIREVQRAANDETKSSSGDKYETGRAMAHLEIEKLSHQLSAKSRALQILSTLPSQQISGQVKPGALVRAAGMIVFIGVHYGEIRIGEKSVQCISSASPLAQSLKGKKAGDEFLLNGILQRVHQVV